MAGGRHVCAPLVPVESSFHGVGGGIPLPGAHRNEGDTNTCKIL